MRRILGTVLYPFSLIYGVLTGVRNILFDTGVFRSQRFEVPVISVGNLSAGGTGKTPVVSYLAGWLGAKYRVAILSRGYGRKTRGFRLAGPGETPATLGDEPALYALRFPNVQVAVCESRVEGIRRLLAQKNPPEVILLDDAFQHRWIKPGLSILLTRYDRPYSRDILLPAGTLRETASNARRAEVIMVTKAPQDVSKEEINRLKNELNPRPGHEFFWSSLCHEPPVAAPGFQNSGITLSYQTSALLVTGIAWPKPLEEYVSTQFHEVKTIRFPDHHRFTGKDLKQITDAFALLPGENKVVLTTEKDLVRLSEPPVVEKIGYLPLFYIPVRICFPPDVEEQFQNRILTYVNRETERND
ncbi:MAG: tetraacyldisaccharide 4'-kinase [Bacteroidales bacterium]